MNAHDTTEQYSLEQLHQTTAGVALTDENRQSNSHIITQMHRAFQVMVRVFGGSFEGREGTLPPLGIPLFNPYNIVASHGGPFLPVAKGVLPSVR
jgi:hypothetical protein